MREVVIVDAVRTPIGRRNGVFAGVHSVPLLGAALHALFERTDIDPACVGQVVGGCVSQVGAQSMNITRNAWLGAGLPMTVGATTIEAQCGSSQQATSIAQALIAAGLVDIAVGCGVESMSNVPMGSARPIDPNVGHPIEDTYRANYEWTTQFEGAERIAQKYGITRSDADSLGVRSQRLAAQAWAEERFSSQIVELDTPNGRATRDEGLRPTTGESLAALNAITGPDGVHTAATSSQISDGAAAVLLMTREKATALGLTPLATIVGSCLVGCDPVLKLQGPIPATRKLLDDTGLSIEDIDYFEVNEAFASVVLAWAEELKADPDRVNPNGGAIALGHPLGATGAVLLTKAVHELAQGDGNHALVTMCCGGGLGTGTVLRRG